MEKIKIEENKKIINGNKIILLNQPTKVIIPLTQRKMEYIPLVQKGEYVYQEEKIAIRKHDHFPLFSTISGIVEMIDLNRIMIRNDYQNRVREYSLKEFDLFKYSKKEVSEILFQNGVMNIGNGKEEPHQQLSSKGIFKTLIISALQGEPYVYLEWFQLKIERKQLLEVIEALIEIYNFEEVLIVLPDHQNLLLEEWTNSLLIGKIKFIFLEEYYVLSDPRELVKQLKNISYEKSPLEKGIVIFNVSTLFSIEQALKYQRPRTKLLVQFTGNMWKENCYMEVRLGTPVKEILQALSFKRAKEVLLLQGGLMKGHPISLDSTVITFEFPIYSAWRALKEKAVESCNRCGKCIKVCPMHLNPVLIMDSMLKNKTPKSFCVERCIECGLCSYVCSSHIPVEEFILKAKEDLL